MFDAIDTSSQTNISPWDEPLYVESKRAFLSPRPASLSALVFVALFLLFVLGELDGLKSLPGIAGLIAVLLFHEGGHALGMRLFGFRDVRMFFIPFLGAAVSGRGRGVAAWKEAVVSLLGPVPGIYLGIALTIASIFSTQLWITSAAQLLLLLNLFNLLPFGALDGGRFLQRVFFSRHRVLDVGFQVLGSVALAWIAISGEMFMLFVFVLLGMLSLPFRYRVLAAAAALPRRTSVAPQDPEQLDDEQLYPIYRVARDVLSATSRENPQNIGQTMESLLEATKPAPSLLATVLLLTSYGVTLVFGLVAIIGLFALNPSPSWHKFKGPGFEVESPHESSLVEDTEDLLQGSRKEHTYRTYLQGAQRFTVVVRELSAPVDPERMLKLARESVAKRTDLTITDRKTLQVAGGRGEQIELASDGRKGRVRLYLVDQTLYEVVATAPKLGDAQQRFLDSFVLIRNP